MKKYEKPMAEFISLAAVEQIAASAEYYDSLTGPEGNIGITSAPSGFWD